MNKRPNFLPQGISLETIKEIYDRFSQNMPQTDIPSEKLEHVHEMNARFIEAFKAGLQPNLEEHVDALLALGLPRPILNSLLCLDALAMLIEDEGDEWSNRMQLFWSDDLDGEADDFDAALEEEINYEAFLESSIYYQMHAHLGRKRLGLAI